MDEVFEVDLALTTPANISKLWSWRAKDHRDIPESIRSQFGTTHECKRSGQGICLVTSSGGGCAVIDRGANKVVWYASVPNAHSIEMLPGDRLVVASSVATNGNRLVLFDLGVPDKPLWHGPLESAHGVVWDEARQRLWAIGYDSLECYLLKDWGSQQPSLERESSYPLPDEGGHDLQPVLATNDLVLSTHDPVYIFDRSDRQFRLHPELKDQRNVKCVSVLDKAGRIVWLQGSDTGWWTDTLKFLQPTGETTLPGEKLYKARW